MARDGDGEVQGTILRQLRSKAAGHVSDLAHHLVDGCSVQLLGDGVRYLFIPVGRDQYGSDAGASKMQSGRVRLPRIADDVPRIIQPLAVKLRHTAPSPRLGACSTETEPACNAVERRPGLPCATDVWGGSLT